MADEQAISHSGENGSTPTDRIGDAEFPLTGASWNLTENVEYTFLNGQASEGDVGRLYSARMDSPPHQANILDPDVAYVRVGLQIGSVAGQGGTRDALFLTQYFANTVQPVSVQEVVDGQAVTTSCLDGEPVSETSELVPDADDTPTVEDDTSVEHDGTGAQDDEV